MAVRPSFRDLRFGLLTVGESVNSIGGWAAAIVLWGFAAYRFDASPYAVSLTIVCWAAPPALLSPLAGVFTDRIGPKSALVAGYVAAAAAALGMAAAVVLPLPLLPAPGRERTAWRRELSEGILLLAHSRGLRLVVTLSVAFTFTSAAYLVVEPLYARHVLHRPPSQFALFEAAAGIGAILANLVISRFRGRIARAKILALSGGCYGLAACDPIPVDGEDVQRGGVERAGAAAVAAHPGAHGNARNAHGQSRRL